MCALGSGRVSQRIWGVFMRRVGIVARPRVHSRRAQALEIADAVKKTIEDLRTSTQSVSEAIGKAADNLDDVTDDL